MITTLNTSFKPVINMSSEPPVPPRPSEAEAESEPPAKISSPPRADEPSSEKEAETQDGNHEGRDATGSQSLAGGSAPGSPAGSTSSQESGEVSPTAPTDSSALPPLPNEAPPLPNEQPPAAEDDGWDFQWDSTHQAYFFYNRFTNETTWENPRLRNTAAAPAASSSTAAVAPLPTAPGTAPTTAEPPKNERPPAGGYNPAIHGDYDPNAWYAKTDADDEYDNNNNNNGAVGAEQEQQVGLVDPAGAHAAVGSFNRFTGQWQAGELNPERHNDEAKSRRQMNAFFDVDAAANSHDGRSLKAERSGKKPSKAELKAFKEKRRAKKEEKRRAWLRD